MSNYSRSTKSPQPQQNLVTPTFTPLTIADHYEVARPAPKMIPTPQLLERLKILPTSETVSKNSAINSYATSNPKSPANELTFGAKKSGAHSGTYGTIGTSVNQDTLPNKILMSTKDSYLDSYSNHQSRMKYNHPNLNSYFQNKMVQHEKQIEVLKQRMWEKQK